MQSKYNSIPDCFISEKTRFEDQIGLPYLDSLNDMILKKENKMYISVENPGLDQLAELAFVKPLEGATERKKKKFVIIMAGVGGTGGYVVRDLSRFLYSIKSRSDEYDIKLILVDPDSVEEKNLLRQNFLPQDLDQNKAEVLASRHARAFSIEISNISEKLDKKLLIKIISNYPSHTPIILGCIDNNIARREIHNYLKSIGNRTYWIDSGNERTSGQVVLGSNKGIPTVTDLFPEILEESADTTETISCAERLMEDEQNIFVNIEAAVHMLNFIRALILNEQSAIHGVRFNISGKVDNFCLKHKSDTWTDKPKKRAGPRPREAMVPVYNEEAA